MCLENNQQIIEIVLWTFLWVFPIGLFFYLKKKGWKVVKDIECHNPKCKTTYWIKLGECPKCGKFNDSYNRYWSIGKTGAVFISKHSKRKID